MWLPPGPPTFGPSRRCRPIRTPTAPSYRGGILNDGFAVEWATDRENGARPAPGLGPQPHRRWRHGVRTQPGPAAPSEPLLERIRSTPFAEHEFDYLNTETFVDRIEVPTYLASQWQDEQTGGSAANLVPLFDPDTEVFASSPTVLTSNQWPRPSSFR